jgi:hypothetical protein
VKEEERWGGRRILPRDDRLHEAVPLVRVPAGGDVWSTTKSQEPNFTRETQPFAARLIT